MAKDTGEQSPVAEPPSTTPASPQKTVVFTRTFTKWMRNDVAGFPADYAEQLIRRGVAAAWDEPRVIKEMVKK